MRMNCRNTCGICDKKKQKKHKSKKYKHKKKKTEEIRVGRYVKTIYQCPRQTSTLDILTIILICYYILRDEIKYYENGKRSDLLQKFLLYHFRLLHHLHLALHQGLPQQWWLWIWQHLLTWTSFCLLWKWITSFLFQFPQAHLDCQRLNFNNMIK